MKIGLFFGSFNPIHTGHLIIAEHINNFYTNSIWFVVSLQNPFKKSVDLLNIESRLLLAKAATKDNKNFYVSDVEFNLPAPSYTIDTISYLYDKYPDFDFSIIMGSDNFLKISNWKLGKLIASTYKIIVYERPEFIVDSKKFNSNIIFVKAPIIDISATEIRKLIQLKKSIQYLVSPEVEYLINKNNYFNYK